MQQNNGNLIISTLAGAIGALIVLVLAANNPTFIRGFSSTTNTPIRDNPATTINETDVAVTSNESTVIETVRRTSPAVVSIVITKDVPVIEQFFEEGPSAGNPFEDFFGGSFFTPFQYRVPQLRQNGTEKQQVGGGSGFLISADGMIITNRHVVEDQQAEYTVFTNEGDKHTARVIARDPANDIAIMKIDGTNFPFLEFGNSDQLQVGQSVIAIGNALSEFQNTVSVGVISGLSRSIVAGDGLGQAEQLDQVIQTDAAINPGNSGGPLLNLAGQVVGVNVAVALGSENIGFALPANAIASVIDSVKRTGTIERPYIGVRYVEITPVLQERNQLPIDHGVLVSRGETAADVAVIPGSPANKAGIVEGDIISEVDGKPLDEKTSLTSIIRTKKIGDAIRLKVLSKGAEKEVSVTLEKSPQ